MFLVIKVNDVFLKNPSINFMNYMENLFIGDGS